MIGRTVSRSLLLLTGLVIIQQSADPGPRPAPAAPDARDPRLYCIKQFFLANDCPAHVYAEDFILAADENGLDWRLLPGIAFIESTGGKEARNNNIFGWDNCNRYFPDTRAGIYHVAGRLANSPLYRNRDVRRILQVYNPNPEYARNVLWVMNQLGPADLPPAGRPVQ